MSLKKLGRYDLVRVLGKGAMGLVYEGRDPNLDRRVAIKTIKVENLSDEAAAEYEVRFRTEARSAARLQHPNIVSVYDSDRDGDIAFLVMEFVQGDDLKHHLDKGEVYTLAQTLGIMGDLLSALSYAHEQKIIHRDIKPANLLVQASGRIKLADFGVARIQDSGDATRTQGSIVGTLKYMSPEQLEGRPIDARADLFAAGVVLYQLLTGTRPFDGDTDFAVIQKIVSYTPAAATSYNAKLPLAIDAVVAKAMAKSRDMRYASAQDFAIALQAACQQAADITITPAGNVPRKGSSSTWTATMMPGESLVTTESGVRISGGSNGGANSGTGASLVTQEVELVYWKDIKESSDIEDLQGFLTKFPSGIYADLARRRLKSLGAPTGQSSDASITRLAGSQAMDKTLVMLRQPDADDLVVAVADADTGSTTSVESVIKPATKPELTDESTPAPPAQVTPEAASTTPPQSKTVLILAGVAVLALAGVAAKLLSGPAAPAAQVAGPQLAASAPAAAAPAPAASRPVVAAVTAVVTATIAAIKPAPAASKATAVTTKKAAPEKNKPTKEEPNKAPGMSAPAADKTVTTANSPRAACEDRMLLGFQSCMAEQCARPIFTNHPICAERRAMDERRREAERNR